MGCRVLDEFRLELVEGGATWGVLGNGFADYTPGGEVRSGVKKTSHGGMKNQDMQTNASGSAVATKMFDAFGNVVSGSGSWSGPYGYGGDYGYQGDVDTGWRLLGHRYYDSDTGRFLTRDPAKDGRNWYAYCGNNPVSAADPVGLAKIWVAWRPVSGTSGHHALIIIKDEETGEIWVFEGGPSARGLDGQGRKIRDGSEYNKIMGYERSLVLDDDKSGQYWVNKATKAIPKRVPYSPVNNGAVDKFLSGNSNSWIRELLENLGLSQKLPTTRKWIPKWYDDPWQHYGKE